VEHTDYFLFTQLTKQLMHVDAVTPDPCSRETNSIVPSDMDSKYESVASAFEVEMLFEDFQALQEVFRGCQEVLEELKTSHICYIATLKEEVKAHLEKHISISRIKLLLN
jgi:hypothetical protein